ncbi:MAG: hypothetical protein ACKPKO_56695 [Candidatus Fonsibacter sp.]
MLVNKIISIFPFQVFSSSELHVYVFFRISKSQLVIPPCSRIDLYKGLEPSEMSGFTEQDI